MKLKIKLSACCGVPPEYSDCCGYAHALFCPECIDGATELNHNGVRERNYARAVEQWNKLQEDIETGVERDGK